GKSMTEAMDSNLPEVWVVFVNGLKPLIWLAKAEIVAIQRVKKVRAEIAMVLFQHGCHLICQRNRADPSLSLRRLDPVLATQAIGKGLSDGDFSLIVVNVRPIQG
ncbi:hypothetical protein PF633_13630, partial [Lacticaseibacillus rhamnosus]